MRVAYGLSPPRWLVNGDITGQSYEKKVKRGACELQKNIKSFRKRLRFAPFSGINAYLCTRI